jgi:hypothetical protein
VDTTLFLREEYRSVKRALFESLKREHISERRREFFDECQLRLTGIANIIEDLPLTPQRTNELVRDLEHVAAAVSLIERAQLGEFSWPFAETIQDFARPLLTEEVEGETEEPIMHIVAHGGEYEVNVGGRPAGARRRIVVIAFPRQLKHHVFYHAIFGHELGHAALKSKHVNQINIQEITPQLARRHLRSPEVMEAWIGSIGGHIAGQVTEAVRTNWLHETICDLFGLVLFGPSFVAAHRALLEPKHPDPNKLGTAGLTHPPYSVRRRTLMRAMRVLSWEKPVSAPGINEAAEERFLDYLFHDPFEDWTDLFSDEEITTALSGITKACTGRTDVRYQPLTADLLARLLWKLSNSMPPVLDGISIHGNPQLHPLSTGQILYAGWVYWFGRDCLEVERPLEFYEANRLCDLALLQQRAIDSTLQQGRRRGNSRTKRTHQGAAKR